MTKTDKPPSKRATKRSALEREADADARAMLLAGGNIPEADKSALQQLLDQMPETEAAVLTLPEFFKWSGMSKSRFYRYKKDSPHLLPPVTMIGNTPMVKRVDAEAWLAKQDVIEVPVQQVLVADGDAPLPPRPRRLRVVVSKPVSVNDAQVPRLFQPPVPNRRRGRPPRSAAAAAKDADDAEPEEAGPHWHRIALTYAHELGHYIAADVFCRGSYPMHTTIQPTGAP